jgi:hypothetical protein
MALGTRQKSRSTIGLISKRSAIPQEDFRHTARGHDRFPKSEYQQFCLRVIVLGRRSHFVQVVYGDHLTCALRARVWHEGSVSRQVKLEKITEGVGCFAGPPAGNQRNRAI